MNIYMMAPIGSTGYGYASLNILKSLVSNNNQVGLSIIGNPSLESQEEADIIQQCINTISHIPYDSACLKIWHQFDLLTKPGKGKYFAFPFFEVDSFNSREIHSLQFPDEIIVSSSWAKQILQQNKIDKPIHVVPLGVDLSKFNYQQQNKTKNSNDKYIFCTIGKWEKRKAHDIIIKCFNSAFENTDNVELWMVTHNPFLNKTEEHSWLQQIESCKLKSKIKVFPRLKDHNTVAEIISYSNCGIYISRGEGWNMELLETMAMNKPVIVSDYSAHTEYCNKDNSFLVDMTETEPAIDNKWFFGQSNWGKIDQNQIDQTIEYMRYCYKNHITNNENGLNTAKQLTWKNTCDMLVGCMT